MSQHVSFSVRLLAVVAVIVFLVQGIGAGEMVSPPRVLYLTLENQVINPVAARSITQALNQARSKQAQCLIIQLDTPGGLMESTRRIVKDILQSDVPVVVYIAPSGARAASAGVFITLSAHVAVMAPGTNIGAAHPVTLGIGGGLPGEEVEKNSPSSSSNPMSEKILNDAVAWARALATLRGRNPNWAARAVRESISTPAEEALKDHVIDFLAANQGELLGRLDGRTIRLPDRTVVLHTQGAMIEHLQMSWPERVLDIVANPNLAYILLLLGFAGLIFEMTHPGFWAPGIMGLICLVLAFFALQELPVNYAGLALLLLGLVLLALEVKVHSWGLLTLAGLACLLLGSFMLIEPAPGIGSVSWFVIAPVSAAMALIVLFLVGNVIRAHQRKIQTGMEGLIGKEGITRTDIQGQGMVFVHGELWRAHSDQPMKAGQAVRVLGYEGLTLQVQPAREQGPMGSNKAVTDLP